MAQTVTTRLPDDFVAALKEIAEKEHVDKSATIRRLLAKAIAEWKKEYALEQYGMGKFSFGQAAKFAKLNVWDFFDLLKERKVMSRYDMEELDTDLKAIKWKKRRQ